MLDSRGERQAPGMEVPWQFQLFGDLRAQRGDIVVTRFATSRVAALLARLALFPQRAHSREELVELLWPDGDFDAGRNSLRVAIASLRRQLEPPNVPAGSVLTADRTVVRLNPIACRSDVAEFEATLKMAARSAFPEKKREALDQAVALFRGELLPGFYDDWILAERERLNALWEDACRRLETLPPVQEQAGAVSSDAALDLPGFPLPFTRFFGREEECAQAIGALRDPQTRLVTLTGPGGAGKTRLAGEVAKAARDAFRGPILFVPLADLTNAGLIPGAIAAALEMALSAQQEPLEQVVTALAGQPPALLVLDNFEQLVEGGAPIVFSLLTRLPALTFLVTSRRRLALPGEREFPVPPLPLPDSEETPEQVAQADSVQLFVDRAQAARPDFQLTCGNAAAVAQLCRRLEGLPLAIELVAARAGAITPAQMAERLGQRFEMITSLLGDKGGRHRSLWAAITWSHDLLPPDLRQFFTRLSVFRGGWDIDGAQSVCEQPQSLEMLTQLRERSLILMEDSGGEMRFRLLESLREFGEEHLSEEEKQALARRHASYYQAQMAQMGTLWFGPNQSRALQTLDAERDNVRAALAFCLSDPPDDDWNGQETGLRLAGALGQYWTTRGLLREGLNWLEAALAGSGSGEARAKALAEAGWMAAGMGEYDRAEILLTESVAISRERADKTATAYALRLRGVAATWRGENSRAATDLKEALALSRTAGNDTLVAGALLCLGVLASQERGDDEEAAALYEEALSLFRKNGDQQRVSYCLHNLGNIAHDAGDYDKAAHLLGEGLALAEALGDHWHRAYCLRSLGDVAEAQGNLGEATRLLEDGVALCRRLGDRMSEAGTLCSLASVALRQDDTAQAQARYETALRLYRDMAHAHGAALCLLGLMEVALSCRQWARVACLLPAREKAGRDIIFSNSERTRIDLARQAAGAALGPNALKAACDQKCGQTWEEAIDAILQTT